MVGFRALRTTAGPAGRSRLNPRLLAVAAAGVVLEAVAVVAVFAIPTGTHIDLDSYRIGIREWLSGGYIYGTLPATPQGYHLPFLYPPFGAVVLTPLELVTRDVAVVGMAAISVLCLGVTVYLFVRRLWPDAGTVKTTALVAVSVPVLTLLDPIRETLGYGQVNILLMAMVAVDCLAERLPIPRGILIGLAAAIKLTPAVFVLFLLVRKDYRASVTAVLSALAASLIGLAVMPVESLRYWFGGMGQVSQLSGTPIAANQGGIALLARSGLTGATLWTAWGVLVVLLVGLAAVGIRAALAAGAPAVAVVLTAACGLLLSPISWTHHWVWAAPALLVLVAYLARSWSPGWIGAVIGAVFVFGAGFPVFLTKLDGSEFTWSFGQWLGGNSFTLAGIVLLIAGTLYARHARSATGPVVPEGER